MAPVVPQRESWITETPETCHKFVATVVGDGCVLGAALSEGAGGEDLKEVYGVFNQKARDIRPECAPNDGDNWLQNLLASASLGGCWNPPSPKPVTVGNSLPGG